MTVFDSNLDDQEWLESYERGEWRSVGSLQREIQRYQEYAASWLNKNRLVSLTLPVSDFERLKERARDTGISYQSLLTELVHKFVSENLVEKN